MIRSSCQFACLLLQFAWVFAGILLVTRVSADEPAPVDNQIGADGGVENRAEVGTVESWIADLDNDQYQARELAHRRLKSAGQDAIDQVVAAANGTSLEQATRAVRILLEWTKSDNSNLRLRALQELVEAGKQQESKDGNP